MSEGQEGSVESSVVISAAASLTPAELAETRALKSDCDMAEGLDLKVSWGDAASESERVFLARLGARLIGYCSLDGDGVVAELCGMVAPDARRIGVGMQLFAAARSAFRQSGGEQLYIICENDSTAGRAFVDALGAQRMFSEYRMEQREADSVGDDGTLVTRELQPGDEENLIAAAQITATGFARSFEQTLRSMREDVTHGAERSYLALADGEPVGAFKLYSEGFTTGIYGFTVNPARQRQGWGRRMLARASVLARAQGAMRVTLEVETTNERAIALYTSSGFVTVTTYGYYLLSRTSLVAVR
jgi:ribosomal protein S18 acetylase RimI-like enzyme